MCDPGDGAPAATGDPKPASAPLVAYVDPFVGTGGQGFAVGSAFPGPQRPFGMVRPGPDTSNGHDVTEFTHCSGYSHGDTYIDGFSHTRMHGTGIADYGGVALMPVIGMTDAKQTQAGHRQKFSHTTESASPGYYAVTLDDTKVKVELSATERVAAHRYTFPVGSDATVVVDAAHVLANTKVSAEVVHLDAASQTVSGSSHVVGSYSNRVGGMTIYFAARFNRPFAKSGSWQNGAWVSFDATTDGVVEASVGISFVDEDHARQNLAAEAAPFDQVRAGAVAAWEAALGKVQLEGRTERDFRLFYTALYHALLMPTLATDTDGSYPGFDGKVHVASGFRFFTDFSLWDTYRTLHPLIDLLYPDLAREMLASLLEMGRALGGMPRWPVMGGDADGMVGDSATVVFADALAKGVPNVDYAAAYDILKKSATVSFPTGRGGVDAYVQKGYIPMEATGASAARTLEYAFDDFTLAGMATALGHPDDAATFTAHAGAWKKLFDPAQGFAVGRHADGTFAPAIPLSWEDYYAEGDAWQYTFLAPHDPEGMATAMGGTGPMLDKLEQLFTHSACKPPTVGLPQPYYWQGNEVDIFSPWLFASLGDSARTARYTRWILASQYGEGPDGLPGNDDSGTMSAWYVFASLGFYPLAGTPTYLLGSPLFTKATLHLPGGDLIVDAPLTSARARYVNAVAFGGNKLSATRITHPEIGRGGSLTFTMSETP
jgi:predicted alpha-1,2-mannosidase